MNFLKKRVDKLEALVRAGAEETHSDKPYKWSDWTGEEIRLAIACLRRDEPLPPELVEKAHLTRPSGRLVGLTEEEIRALADGLRERGDEPEDDEPESEMF